MDQTKKNYNLFLRKQQGTFLKFPKLISRFLSFKLGRETASVWKWYNIMDDLAQAEFMLRESFDATSKLHAGWSNSPILTINEDEDETDNEKRNHFNISGGLGKL